MRKDNLNHRLDSGTEVRITKGSTAKRGVVVTDNASGSYGVRIGSGRAAQIVECRPVELEKIV